MDKPVTLTVLFHFTLKVACYFRAWTPWRADYGKPWSVVLNRLLVIYSGSDEGNSATLFRELGRVASDSMQVRYSPNTLLKGNSLGKLWNNLVENVSRAPQIVWADGIVVHNYVALSTLSILFARLLRKKVIVVNWDIYPSSINGARQSGKFRMLADCLENAVIRLATRVVIPTEDFRPHLSHPHVTVVPLWPTARPLDNLSTPPYTTIKIAFAGQVDVTRGLSRAIETIARSSNAALEFHVFSSGARLKDVSIPANCQIVYYPHLSRGQVLDLISEMHFGLVSLHEGLDHPGYPSKTFDYLSANLPILYFGRRMAAFCASIENFKVGHVYRVGDDLRQLHADMRIGWKDNRDAFLAYTELTQDKIALMTC